VYCSLSINSNPTALIIGLILSAAFIYVTVRRRSLTLSGAFTAAAIGCWVIWFAGPVWLIPLFFFFLSGTLLSRLNKGSRTAADAKAGQPRDAVQVLCNGGIYALLATWAATPDAFWYLGGMLASIAVSTSDTWASETGIYFRRATWDMLRWKRVPVGLSGGVSDAGSLGGLAGAAAMAAVGFLLLQKETLFLSVLSAGFGGMLLDSLLGAAFQARYLLKNGGLSDTPDGHSGPASGLYWMTNDAVNLLSNIIATFTWCLLNTFL
jgi:uncharacterized protein (TIGR00297 family)